MSDHHPSCRPSDRDLVWLCAQCGGHESAESILDERKRLVALVEAAYKEGRGDGFDSVAATDEYNDLRWQVSQSKRELDALLAKVKV